MNLFRSWPVVPLTVDIRARDPIASMLEVAGVLNKPTKKSMCDLYTSVLLFLLRQISKDIHGWFLIEAGAVNLLNKVA